MIADGVKKKRFTLLDATTYQQITTFDYSDDVHSWMISPNGKYLLTLVNSDQESSATLWDVLNSRPLRTFKNFVDTARFTSDSRYLAFANQVSQGSIDLIYHMWDIELNAERPNFQLKDALYSPLSFTPNGQYVLIPSRISEKSVGYRIWDIELDQQITTISIQRIEDYIRISPNGEYMAVGSQYGELHLWNLLTGIESPLDC
jgi:WD40 repeat protein